MFEIGFAELFLLGVIALLVVGPDRLPALARTVGVWVGRAQRLVGQVRADIEREVRADELRRAAKEYSPTAALTDMRKEVEDFASEVSKPVDIDAKKTEAESTGSENADQQKAEPGKAESGNAGQENAEPGKNGAEPNGSEDAAAPTAADERGAGDAEAGGTDAPEKPEVKLAEAPATEMDTDEPESGVFESAEPEARKSGNTADVRPDAGEPAAHAEPTEGGPENATPPPVTESAETPPAEPDERSAAA